MILDQLVTATRRRLDEEKKHLTLAALESQISDAAPPPFMAALQYPDRLGIISEIKQASPSRGMIVNEFDAKGIAQKYQAAGADCLSVLTEPEYFRGTLGDLTAAHRTSGLPCLRKDFIIDPYQVAQARVHGASCILLIAAILSDWELRSLRHAAAQYGLECLLEVHDETEARRAALNKHHFIGINNRNLNDFSISLETTEKLRPLLPPDAVVVAESGIFTGADAARMRAAGVDALLVGEALMKAPSADQLIKELKWGTIS